MVNKSVSQRAPIDGKGNNLCSKKESINIPISIEGNKAEINASGIDYCDLNEKIRYALSNGTDELTLNKINGQRYIGCGLGCTIDEHGIKKYDKKIIINGIPGQDLGIFMDGMGIIVNSNAQDNVGNTMNDGKIVVHGLAGDTVGYSMRNGKIFIRDDVGYRVGIHMKEYGDKIPVIIAGGTAGDFFGEYMAGGILIALGLNVNGKPIVGNYVGTGMHGGVIYLRGNINESQIGKEVGIKELTDKDFSLLEKLLKEFSNDLNLDYNKITENKFIKLVPESHRPYGKLYAV